MRILQKQDWLYFSANRRREKWTQKLLDLQQLRLICWLQTGNTHTQSHTHRSDQDSDSVSCSESNVCLEPRAASGRRQNGSGTHSELPVGSTCTSYSVGAAGKKTQTRDLYADPPAAAAALRKSDGKTHSKHSHNVTTQQRGRNQSGGHAAAPPPPAGSEQRVLGSGDAASCDNEAAKRSSNHRPPRKHKQYFSEAIRHLSQRSTAAVAAATALAKLG